MWILHAAVNKTVLVRGSAVGLGWIHCNDCCWCKNTRCIRAALWPGADILELLPATPKTTSQRLQWCQLTACQSASPSPLYPSWAFCDYQRPMKKQRTQTCSGALTPTLTYLTTDRLAQKAGGRWQKMSMWLFFFVIFSLRLVAFSAP